MSEENKANDEAQPKQQLPEFKVTKKPEEEKKTEQSKEQEDTKIDEEETKTPKVEEFKFNPPE